jgi:hypothetical protein
MTCLRPGLVIKTIAVCALVGLNGCVTSKKYRPAKQDTPPAVPLNLAAESPALALRLATVIVCDGPGSWKQRALWDEYVVSLANRGAEPLVLESAALVDLLGAEQVPGAYPWKLEQVSEGNWGKYGPVGQFVFGAGAFAGMVELSAIGYGLAGGVASGVFFAMPAFLVVDFAVVGVMNHRNKAKVQAEFERRRLKLPLTLAPGGAAEGSLFFPLVPAPQRLIVRGQANGASMEIVLELLPLAGLHCKPAAQD